MNPVPKNCAKPSGCSGFVYRKQKNRERRFLFFSHGAVEVASAGTSVIAYHPLRTIATQLSAGVPLQWKFVSLYRGFWPSAFGAHQLFLMGAFERRLKQFIFQEEEEPAAWQRFAIGATAGVMTAPTVTPFEMAGVQKQLNRTFAVYDPATFYRGFFPVAYRQAGLGAGMFILPRLLAEKYREEFPDYAARHENQVKLTAGLVGGCFTATATQFFEASRLLMQQDVKREKYPTTWRAFQSTPNQLFSVTGGKMFAVRLSVVAVATMVMNNSRDFFSQWVGKEDESKLIPCPTSILKDRSDLRARLMSASPATAFNMAQPALLGYAAMSAMEW